MNRLMIAEKVRPRVGALSIGRCRSRHKLFLARLAEQFDEPMEAARQLGEVRGEVDRHRVDLALQFGQRMERHRRAALEAVEMPPRLDCEVPDDQRDVVAFGQGPPLGLALLQVRKRPLERARQATSYISTANRMRSSIRSGLLPSSRDRVKRTTVRRMRGNHREPDSMFGTSLRSSAFRKIIRAR